MWMWKSTISPQLDYKNLMEKLMGLKKVKTLKSDY